MRAKVLLPAPFSPIKAWTSPAVNSKRAALKAATPPKCLLMFSARRNPICRRYVAAARASIALVLDFLPPIMARRQPHQLLEIPAEIELVAIAQFLGDGADGGLALRQAALGLADALAPEPVQRGGAGRLAEAAEEMRRAPPRQRRQFLDPPGAANLAAHAGEHGMKLGIAPRRLGPGTQSC